MVITAVKTKIPCQIIKCETSNTLGKLIPIRNKLAILTWFNKNKPNTLKRTPQNFLDKDAIAGFHIEFVLDGYTTVSDPDGSYYYGTIILDDLKLSGILDVYTGPVWHVTDNGSDDLGDGSYDFPFGSIQSSLCKSSFSSCMAIYFSRE